MVLGLAACNYDLGLPSGIEITISPPALTLFVGQTAQVVATVTGLSNPAVRYSSSNPAIATVDAKSGLVTGVVDGSASIIAQAVADPSLQAAASVTVMHGDSFVDEVTIRAITVANTNVPVNPDDVAGRIDVTVSFTRWTADELQVLIGGARPDTVVYSQRFGGSATASGNGPAASPAAIQAEVVVSINTAAVDAATGAPAFPDGGGYLVKVRLLRAGTPIPGASAVWGQQLTLNNAGFLSTTTISAPTRQRGRDDLGGSVTPSAVHFAR